MPEILLPKLLPPQLKRGILYRPRLVDLFAGIGDRKMTLLLAPAGYGKTVSMLQAAIVGGYSLVWYQLDSYDNDLAVFLRYLVTGIERKIPGFGKQVQQIIGGGVIESSLRLLVATVVNELSQHADIPLLVVFDDYHEIIEPLVHRFLQDLVEHLPAQIHVMIASRTKPCISLSRLKTADDLLVIGAAELRFTGEELQAFLAQRAPKISVEAREFLSQKVNGWPAAVKLVADSASGDGSRLQINGSAAEIYEYLAAEVLEQQSESVREFLQKSAVLDVITAQDCDLLLKRDDSQTMLDVLEKQSLFIVPLAGQEKSYRYHQLFREFLLERLGTERQFWQIEAGIVARSRGDFSAAVEYFGAAGAKEELKAVLKEAGQQAFSQGRWQTVVRWLEAIDEEESITDPWLSLYRAKGEVYRGRLNKAEGWLNGAVSLFAVSGEHAGMAESRFLQARILRGRGRFDDSLELLDRALYQLPEEESLKNFNLYLEKSFCLFSVGRLSEAEPVLTGALDAAKRLGNEYVMAHLLEGLGHVYSMQGDLPKALRMYQQGAETLPDRIRSSYHTQDYIAYIYLDWGEWEKALDYAQRDAVIKEKRGLTDALPCIYNQLASIYNSRGEWGMAEEYCNRAINLSRKNNGDRTYLAMSLAILAECLGLQGRWLDAREKAEEALDEARSFSFMPENVCQLLGSLSFVHTGDFHRGRELLTTAIRGFERAGFKRGLCYGYAFQAWLNFSERNLAATRQYMKKVLELAATHNILNLFLTYYDMLQPMLKLALEDGVEVIFVQRILVRMGERALCILAGLAGNSYPEVRMRTIAPLAEIGGPEAREIIYHLMDDQDMGIRRLAKLAAQRLGIVEFTGVDIETSVPPLHITTLGSFQVFLREVKIIKRGWRTTKTRDLLAYLVHRGEPVSKDRIMEDLWPDTDPEHATAIFHSTLYFLRKALTNTDYPEIISYGNRHYQLGPGVFSSDRQQFQELVVAGLRADTIPETATALLEQAISIYRGDYLQDLDYSWLIPYQERLKSLHIEARMRLAQYYVEARDYTRAVSHLKIIEEYDPLAEMVHALLMKVYARQGKRSAVKKQYQKLEAVLQQELGLLPSRATRYLFQRLVE